MLSPSAANIIHLPLAFVRSGYVSINDSEGRLTGSRGYNWSHTLKSLTLAYNLGMNPSVIGISDTNYHWSVFPLR